MTNTDPELGKVGEATGTPMNKYKGHICCPECYHGFGNRAGVCRLDYKCSCHSTPTEDVQWIHPIGKVVGNSVPLPSQEVKWEKEFNEKFIEKIGGSLWIQHMDAIPKVKKFISNLLSNSSTHLLEELEREVSGMRRSFPLEHDLKDHCDFAYNQALSDIQTLLKNKQK